MTSSLTLDGPAVSTGNSSLHKLVIIAARWRFIAATTILGAAIASAVAFYLPDQYTAAALVMPPQQPQSAATALLGQLGPVAGIATHELGMKNMGEMCVGILASRTVADRLVSQFHLREVYRAETLTNARKKLAKYSKFTIGKDTLLKIEVDDINPVRAAGIANAYVKELNDENVAFQSGDGGERRQFLESRLSQEKDALAAAEQALKQTQVRTGLLQVDGQTQMAIATIAQMRAQIAAAEVELQRLRISATDANPEVRRGEAELTALRGQLTSLEQSPAQKGDPFLPSAKLPEVGLEYIRALREVKYHEFLFETLSRQYEAARLDESKQTPVIQIVDSAVPPERKSGPHRALIVLLGFAVSLLLASFLAYLRAALDAPEYRCIGRALRASLARPTR